MISSWEHKIVPQSMFLWQVGAIVLYTFVFQMLSPPPGGSFDCPEVEKLPIKSPPFNPSPEQVPLLTAQGLEPSELPSKGGKVEIYEINLVISFFYVSKYVKGSEGSLPIKTCLLIVFILIMPSFFSSIF